MKKNVLFILCLVPIYAIGQSDCPEVVNIRKEVSLKKDQLKTLQAELLWNQQTFPEKLIEKKVLRNYNESTNTFSMEIENVSQEKFMELCNSGKPDMAKLSEKYPDAMMYTMYSCKRENNQTIINAYVEIIRNPALDEKNATKQRQLEKIRNTRKMYMDIIDALDNEIDFNKVEVVDNASELLMKHIPVDNKVVENIMGFTKEEAMNALRGGKILPSTIENPVADNVNKFVNITEKVIDFIPGGSKITNHYLWRLFKSTPEAGKGLGHTAAIVNIYFRQKEYRKLIDELNKEEQKVLNE